MLMFCIDSSKSEVRQDLGLDSSDVAIRINIIFFKQGTNSWFIKSPIFKVGLLTRIVHKPQVVWIT